MATTTDRRHLYEEMGVQIPVGQHGTVAVEKFTVDRDSLENLRLAMQPGGRSCLPGEYTRLTRNGYLWMSDTTAERSDHLGVAMKIAGHYLTGEGSATRVLIGGLGLGMILRVALLTPGMERVDVVEIDPDVIALVGPHYQEMAAERGVELVIHQADLYQITWPTGTRWDVAWFDIWADMSTDVLEEMTPLMRSYGRRATWKNCWGREILQSMKRREARTRWW